MKRRKEKKSESLDIRLPYEQKREFMEATRKRGETASQALREFIATYIEEARLAEHPNPVQEITMTLARHRLKTIATATGAALGVFSIAALPSAADSTAFEKLDKNKDGVITEGEILPGADADIIAKLDTDGSGGVSQEELEAAGNHIVVRSSVSDDDEDGTAVTKTTVKVLEFSDAEEGEITGEVSTTVDRRIVVKRIGSGEELSEADIEVLLDEALSEAGVGGRHEVDVEVIVKDVMDALDEAETED
ncbi:MAG: hypothetical protein AAGG72_09400 [Pseudomonadota bacterium]